MINDIIGTVLKKLKNIDNVNSDFETNYIEFHVELYRLLICLNNGCTNTIENLYNIETKDLEENSIYVFEFTQMYNKNNQPLELIRFNGFLCYENIELLLLQIQQYLYNRNHCDLYDINRIIIIISYITQFNNIDSWLSNSKIMINIFNIPDVLQPEPLQEILHKLQNIKICNKLEELNTNVWNTPIVIKILNTLYDTNYGDYYLTDNTFGRSLPSNISFIKYNDNKGYIEILENHIIQKQKKHKYPFDDIFNAFVIELAYNREKITLNISNNYEYPNGFNYLGTLFSPYHIWKTYCLISDIYQWYELYTLQYHYLNSFKKYNTIEYLMVCIFKQNIVTDIKEYMHNNNSADIQFYYELNETEMLLKILYPELIHKAQEVKEFDDYLNKKKKLVSAYQFLYDNFFKVHILNNTLDSPIINWEKQIKLNEYISNIFSLSVSTTENTIKKNIYIIKLINFKSMRYIYNIFNDIKYNFIVYKNTLELKPLYLENIITKDTPTKKCYICKSFWKHKRCNKHNCIHLHIVNDINYYKNQLAENTIYCKWNRSQINLINLFLEEIKLHFNLYNNAKICKYVHTINGCIHIKCKYFIHLYLSIQELDYRNNSITHNRIDNTVINDTVTYVYNVIDNNVINNNVNNNNVINNNDNNVINEVML